ncbi:hypothetical protein EV182_000777 [Spiromyces aspiralis]|uniref:Uncharacterized protein n=1 Tax=Spiromyces aspiralis TaxID=68401 RepID=A0ACC1HWC8_9FUNG|nr:hypothetical protein EV182_000777 [Spiromyces aspiralis]
MSWLGLGKFIGRDAEVSEPESNVSLDSSILADDYDSDILAAEQDGISADDDSEDSEVYFQGKHGWDKPVVANNDPRDRITRERRRKLKTILTGSEPGDSSGGRNSSSGPVSVICVDLKAVDDRIQAMLEHNLSEMWLNPMSKQDRSVVSRLASMYRIKVIMGGRNRNT